jgi:hypothetical protein
MPQRWQNGDSIGQSETRQSGQNMDSLQVRQPAQRGGNTACKQHGSRTAQVGRNQAVHRFGKNSS